MKKLISLLMLLVIIAVAVYAGSPYYTAYQLKNAYDAKDGAAIAAAIDYEQLRPNIKNQLTSDFANTIASYPLVAELGGEPLTQAANSFIEQSVDGAITAQNIERLIETQGQANTATKELAAAWAISSTQKPHPRFDHSSWRYQCCGQATSRANDEQASGAVGATGNSRYR